MKVSVIIPTLNEEENIAPAIARLRLSSDHSRVEIIVADGGSSDRTPEIARTKADKLIRVEQRGRALQMQKGALAAAGELLLFLHADTRLPEDWLDELTHVWSSANTPVATAFRLGFESPDPYYRFVSRLASLRTGLTRVPHGDQGIALRRDTFLRIGGFPSVPLMEEYELFKRLRPLGRVMILPGSVATSTRRYERNGRIFNALRSAGIILLYHLGVPPRSLARLYR